MNITTYVLCKKKYDFVLFGCVCGGGGGGGGDGEKSEGGGVDVILLVWLHLAILTNGWCHFVDKNRIRI